MRAPRSAVLEELRTLAEKRRVLCSSRHSYAHLSFLEVVSPAIGARVKEYESHLRARYGSLSLKPFTANVQQHVRWAGAPKPHVVPTLLRNSMLWIFDQGPYALPLDHLELQGYSIYDEATDIERCQFVDALRQLSNTQTRHIAGNAMHLRVVSAVLMFVIACTTAG